MAKEHDKNKVYDIKKDPFEHNNLVNNKNIKEKIQKELKILKKSFEKSALHVKNMTRMVPILGRYT